MDLYEYIKADHKKVSDLFALFEKTENTQIQLQIVALIIKELVAHLDAEQKTFYRALEKFQESAEAAKHGEKEHAEIEQLIKTLTGIKQPDAAWHENVLQLKKLVEHHVSEEEGTVHKKAQKVLSDADAFIIKEQMHYLKGKILLAVEA